MSPSPPGTVLPGTEDPRADSPLSGPDSGAAREDSPEEVALGLCHCKQWGLYRAVGERLSGGREVMRLGSGLGRGRAEPRRKEVRERKECELDSGAI